MDKQDMTAEEFQEYLKTLPDDVIVRVTVMEDRDGRAENETV